MLQGRGDVLHFLFREYSGYIMPHMLNFYYGKYKRNMRETKEKIEVK